MREWPLAAGLAGGVSIDALLGDPRRAHPVAAFGRAMTALERAAYADRRLRGTVFAASGVALAVAPALAAARLPRRSAATAALTALATWAVSGARSLCAEATRIGSALESGDLDRARGLLPNLCGRDPARLDIPGLSRAVVESVAENTSDGLVAPLTWGVLVGPAGLTGYRAVNTMDAMVGHHSPRYERFGWASARLDDVANWAPARLTALLTAACAPVVGGRPAATWRIVLQYGRHHPSPNAGWCEAAFAGALGLRLGGQLSYAGRSERRPVLGNGRPPGPADIARAVRLCRAVTAAAAFCAASAALASSAASAPRSGGGLVEPGKLVGISAVS